MCKDPFPSLPSSLIAPKTNTWLGNDSCFAEVFLDGDVIGFSSSSLRSSRPDVARFVGRMRTVWNEIKTNPLILEKMPSLFWRET